jgi:hypothetical protein
MSMRGKGNGRFLGFCTEIQQKNGGSTVKPDVFAFDGGRRTTIYWERGVGS